MASSTYALKRRKHRPKGSWLVRPCTCHVKRQHLEGPQFCVVHRLLSFVTARNKGVCGPDFAGLSGMKLFNFSAQTFLSTLRRFVSLLRFRNAEKLTLKVFRAGKATALANEGINLG